LVAKAHVEEPKVRALLSRAKELWTTLKVGVLGFATENDDADPKTAATKGPLKFFDLLRGRQRALLALPPPPLITRRLRCAIDSLKRIL
jgi:hypothetical protein